MVSEPVSISRERRRQQGNIFADVGHPALWLRSNGAIHDANEAACALLDMALRDLEKRTLFDLFVPLREDATWQSKSALSLVGCTKQLGFSKSDTTDAASAQASMCVRVDATFYRALAPSSAAPGDGVLMLVAATEVRDSPSWVASDDLFSQLFHNSSEAVLLHEMDGRIVDVNNRAQQRFGFSAVELRGQRIYELYREQEPADIKRIVGALGERGTYRYRAEFKSKQDSSFRAEVSVTRLVRDGRTLMHCSIKDITNQLLTEKEMRLAAHAFESSEALMVADSLGQVYRVNRAFSKLTGFTTADLKGLKPKLLEQAHFYDQGEFSPGTSNQLQLRSPCIESLQSLCEALRCGERWRGVISAQSKSGTALELGLSVSALGDGYGAATHLVFHLEDLGKRRAEEHALREAREQAELANKAKSRFIATISHELRTPLNAVISMNELLLETNLEEEQRTFAQGAHDGGRALLSVINDVLDFSKIEAGRLNLEEAEFNPVPLIEGVAELFAGEAQQKKIEIGCVLDASLPATMTGDPQRIQQIISNLVSNAVKFTERGGVRLDACVGELNGAPALEVQVSDTGVGIEQAEFENVFCEFTQTDSDLSRKHGGTGLGLAICRRLCSLMQGTISVESKLGAGSRFSLRIPLRGDIKNAQSRSELDLAEAIRDASQVLVCMGEALLRDALADQLASFAIETTVVGGLAELERWLRDSPRATSTSKGTIALVDDELAEQLQAASSQEPQQALSDSVKFVRLAPFVGLVANDRYKAAGFVRSLRKPVRRHLLLNALNEIGSYDDANRGEVDDTATLGFSRGSTSMQGRILLVEDSRANQLVTTTILRKIGFSVDVATNGREALQSCERERFDLVLMDIAMPEMDGLTATRILRDTPGPNRDTPIVAMTANAFVEDRERAFGAGMNDFLVKPIVRRDLMNVLHAIFKDCAVRPTTSADAHASVEPGGSVLELRALAQLALDTDPALLPKIVDVFTRESKLRLTEIEQAANAGEKAPRDELHTLKSTALTFGLRRFGEAAARLEALCKRGPHHMNKTEARSLCDLFERSLTELQSNMAPVVSMDTDELRRTASGSNDRPEES